MRSARGLAKQANPSAATAVARSTLATSGHCRSLVSGLTRDLRRYRTYFPTIHLIAPTPAEDQTTG